MAEFGCEHRDLTLEELIRKGIGISPAGVVTFNVSGSGGGGTPVNQNTSGQIVNGSVLNVPAGTYYSYTILNVGNQAFEYQGINYPSSVTELTFTADSGNKLGAFTLDPLAGTLILNTIV